MTKKIPAECILFKEWFDNLPHSQRNGIKKIIADACYVSLYAIDNWLYGKASINMVFREKINKIAGETIFLIPEPKNA